MKIEIDGAPVHIATGGKEFDASKPTVIFIHGSGQNRVGWSQQSRAFAYAGYNALAPDLPGHGLSGGEAPRTIERGATWIVALMDALNIERAHLIGHSQGALIALECAGSHRPRVASLAMVASAAAIPVNPMLIRMAEDKEPRAIAAMTAWGTGGFGHAWDSDVPGAGTIGAGKALMAQNAPGSLAIDLKACNAYKSGEAAAGRVRCPTLCLLAERDMMTPLKFGRRLAGMIEGAEMRVMPEAGHMLPSERPIETLAALREFVDKAAME